MASGVSVCDGAKRDFDMMKKDKSFRFLILAISEDERVVQVEKRGHRHENYASFLRSLTSGGSDECRYGVYDYEYEHQCEGTTDTTRREKLVLVSWCPDAARIKTKMVYSASFDALKKCLVGVQKYIQATDETEASAEAVEEKLRSTDRV